MVKVQENEAAKVELQVFAVIANCVPVVRAMLEIFSVAPPAFVSVTVWVAVGVLTSCLPNRSEVELKLTTGIDDPL